MSRIFLSTLILVALSTLLISCGQSNAPANTANYLSALEQDSIAYLQKCIEFIKQIKHQELSNPDFILLDEPSDDSMCINQVLTDSMFSYSQADIKIIKERRHFSSLKWSRMLYSNLKFVSDDSLYAIFFDTSKGWKYYRERIGSNTNWFSIPIFLENDHYCLFYSGYSCGPTCGEAKLALYRKDKNGWVEILSYCHGVG